MDRHAKIYVAGHRGLVGSALMRRLRDPRVHIVQAALGAVGKAKININVSRSTNWL